MPLLKRGPEIFPQSLFDLDETRHPWFVAYTRSRQEKVLARHLAAAHAPFYLPLGERQSERSDRARTSYIPLFPSYLFLRGGAAVRATALRSHVVARLIDVADQPQLGEELEALRSLQLAGASLTPTPAIGVGDEVCISDGPFCGYRGRVVREVGRLRLIVTISMLRQSVAVEFERDNVRPSPWSRSGLGRSAVA